MQKKSKLLTLRDAVASKERDVVMLEEKVTDQGIGREKTAEHSELLTALSARKARIVEMETELERFAEFDPETVAKITDSMSAVKEAANRWTDNVFCCQSWIVNTFGIERADFFRQFEIPADLDYL